MIRLVLFCKLHLDHSVWSKIFVIRNICINVKLKLFHFSRIHPVEWHETIGMRFNVIGCTSPSPTPFFGSTVTPPSVTTITPRQTPTATSTSVAPTACMYWTPWVNKNKPDDSGEFESLWDMKSVVKFCDVLAVKAIECRTAGTHIKFDEVTGQKGVVCDLNNKGLLCEADEQSTGTCQDYEIRAYCDECMGPTTQSVTNVTPSQPLCTQNKWSDWINRDNPTTENYDHDFMTKQEQSAFCNGGQITSVECQDKFGTDHISTGEMMTCDVQNGVMCRNIDNFPVTCSDYKIRYYCNCGCKFFISFDLLFCPDTLSNLQRFAKK